MREKTEYYSKFQTKVTSDKDSTLLLIKNCKLTKGPLIIVFTFLFYVWLQLENELENVSFSLFDSHENSFVISNSDPIIKNEVGKWLFSQQILSGRLILVVIIVAKK